MKQVVEPAMVAHLWAHQTQEYARNSGGSFYFRNENIYSYGPHFRCGSVVRNQKRQTAYLVTDQKYSVTTSQHMNYVRKAIPAYQTVFTTDRFVDIQNDKLTDNSYLQAIYYITDRVQQIDELIYKQKRASRCDYIGYIEVELCSIARWIEFWRLNSRQRSESGEWLCPVIPQMLSHEWTKRDKYWRSREYNHYVQVSYADKFQYQGLLQLIVEMGLLDQSRAVFCREALCELCARWTNDADVAARSAVLKRLMTKAEQKRKKAQQERKKAELKAFEGKVSRWRRCDTYTLTVPDCYRSNAVLRVRDHKVETSLGVTVDATEAARVWQIIRRYHDRKADFRHDVIRDASNHPWTINSFENDVMWAGCHKLHFDDMAYAAQQLGLAE